MSAYSNRLHFVIHPFLRAPRNALALGLPFFLCLSAGAQAPSRDPDRGRDRQLAPVVVTATRMAQPLPDVLADVTVIDREQIERSGSGALADLLARQPGMAFTRTGGPAATTGVFVRGAETRHTAVFIDGVRVDSQATGGATWNAIPLSQIERIEVLRGPAAAIYGSDAIAGVVQVFTRRGEGLPLTPSLSVGAGTHGTRTADASVRGSQGTVDYSIGIARETSEGFNAQPLANPDRDGYRSTAASGSVGWRLAPGHRLEATGLVNDQKAQYDGFLSTADDWSLTDLRTLGLNWTAQWTPAYSTRLSVSRGSDRYESRPSPYIAETRVTSLLLHNEWRSGPHSLSADLERREDRLDNATTTPTISDRFQNAIALGYGWRRGDHTLQVNVRHDEDSEFGGDTNGIAAYGYEFRPGWSATASVGTAFRSPTLFQRFSLYGVPSLRPESSTNREVGIKHVAGDERTSVAVYRNDVTDLINFVPGPGVCAAGVGPFAGCYGNVGSARLEGLTFAAQRGVGPVKVGASLDLQKPVDRDTGNLLARRARRMATLTADTRVAGWALGSELQLVGERFNDVANRQPMSGYGLVNVHATRDIARDWRLLLRVDNVGDKDHQTALGYATAGRTFYTSVRWEPK